MNQRQKKILSLLCSSTEFQTVQNIATTFSISTRTVQTDLKVIEECMENSKYQLLMDRKKGLGIRIDGNQSEKHQFLSDFEIETVGVDDSDSQDKLLIFYLLIAKKTYSLDELSEMLFTNRRQITKLLEDIQVMLSSFKLLLISKPKVGTFIQGEERKKREQLARILKDLGDREINQLALQDFFSQEKLTVIQHMTAKSFDEESIAYLPEFSSIDIHLYFMLERMREHQGIKLSQSERDEVKNTRAQKISSTIFAKLSEVYPVSFSPDEIDYLALRILSALRLEADNHLQNDKISDISEQLVDKIGQLLDVNLTDDHVLLDNLKEHLSSTYLRMNHGFTIANPLTKEVLGTYTQLFVMIQMILEELFENDSFYIYQEEIAYLTIHFQAAIERQKKKKVLKYKTLLICEYTRAMAIFLEAKLQHEIPELEIIESSNASSENFNLEDYDLIISTVQPKYQPAIPLIEISPMISDADLKRIKQYTMEHSPKSQLNKSLDISKMTNPFLVFPNVNFASEVELLTYMGEQLLRHDYVKEGFVESVLNREERSSTRVAPLIAMPHGNPSLVNSSVISICTLKTPINWHGEGLPVQLVILLSLKKEDLKNQNFRKVFSMIHYLGKHPMELSNILKQTQSLELIRLFSDVNH